MISHHIQSDPDPETPRPWYEVDVADRTVTVTTDADAGTDNSVEGDSVDLPDGGKIAVSTDGSLLTNPTQKDDVRTNLVWESNASLHVLEFVEQEAST
jgi:hypothetical protein